MKWHRRIINLVCLLIHISATHSAGYTVSTLKSASVIGSLRWSHIVIYLNRINTHSIVEILIIKPCNTHCYEIFIKDLFVM